MLNKTILITPLKRTNEPRKPSFFPPILFVLIKETVFAPQGCGARFFFSFFSSLLLPSVRLTGRLTGILPSPQPAPPPFTPTDGPGLLAHARANPALKRIVVQSSRTMNPTLPSARGCRSTMARDVRRRDAGRRRARPGGFGDGSRGTEGTKPVPAAPGSGDSTAGPGTENGNSRAGGLNWFAGCGPGSRSCVGDQRHHGVVLANCVTNA